MTIIKVSVGRTLQTETEKNVFWVFRVPHSTKSYSNLSRKKFAFPSLPLSPHPLSIRLSVCLSVRSYARAKNKEKNNSSTPYSLFIQYLLLSPPPLALSLSLFHSLIQAIAQSIHYLQEAYVRL